MVAIEGGADLQPLHAVGVDFSLLHPVHPESGQIVLLCEEAKPVPVLQIMAGYSEKILSHGGDFTQILSDGFLRVHGGNLFSPAGNEVLGIAAVEGPVRVRRKGERAHAGTALPVIGMPADESVDGLPVGGRDILYILDPLVSSFDFKGGNPGRNQVRYGCSSDSDL